MASLRIADVVVANIETLRTLSDWGYPDAAMQLVYAKGVSPSSARKVKQVLLTNGIDIEALQLAHAEPSLRSVQSLLNEGWTRG